MPIERFRNSYYWRTAPGQPRVRLGDSLKEALMKVDAMPASAKRVPVEKVPREPKDEGQIWWDMLWRLYSTVRMRAVKRDEAFLSPEAFNELWDRSRGACELTGIAFSLDKAPGHVRRPWAPSVDRVDNSRGYVFDNCRLVCVAVNIAMNEWGEDALWRISSAFVKKGRPQKREV